MNAPFRFVSRFLGTLVSDFSINSERINDGLVGTNGRDYQDVGYGVCKMISLILDSQF
jgi:hypothetical protein